MSSLYHNVGDDENPNATFNSVRFCYMTGVLMNSDKLRFQRLIFRTTRGNAFVNLIDIPVNFDMEGKPIDCMLDTKVIPQIFSLK